jgi:hypothetical protein
VKELPFFFKNGLSTRKSCVTFKWYSLEALPQKGLQRFNKKLIICDRSLMLTIKLAITFKQNRFGQTV